MSPRLKRITLAVHDTNSNRIHKVVKIVPYREVGFAVTVPYHRERSGTLLRIPIAPDGSPDYSRSTDRQLYTASDRVKLSLHADGFVQFSGESGQRIRSGRDPVSGQPRGLAVLSASLKDPIQGSPTFGVIIRGLQDFEEISSSEQANAIVFSDYDFHYADMPDLYDSYGEQQNLDTYIIEGFVLPLNYWSVVKNTQGKLSMQLAFAKFRASYGIMELRVVPLPNQPFLLAFLFSRTADNSATESRFSLTSPQDKQRTMIMATYPPLRLDVAAESLDYNESDGAL